YCGAPAGIEKQTSGLVARWKRVYGRVPRRSKRLDDISLLGSPQATQRYCQNGKRVMPVQPAGESVGQRR
ncbi:MAG: hypothetical protein AAFR04_14995, partial [Pseudomonadota bacterium]